MRILIIAALAASLTGAAWAGTPEDYGQCNHHYGREVDAAEINAIVQEALSDAMAQIREAEIDAATADRIEAHVEAAMVRAERELEGHDGATARWTEADRERVEARVEAAMARVEAALDRAVERLEDAESEREPKSWRPRY